MGSYDKILEYLKKFKNPKLITDFNGMVLDFADEQGQAVIAKTKQRTPVDTGALKSSWQKTKAKRTSGGLFYVKIENNQEYASYVEYGTPVREWKWKNGAFMLSKSMNEVRENMQQNFHKKFNEFMKQRGIG